MDIDFDWIDVGHLTDLETFVEYATDDDFDEDIHVLDLELYWHPVTVEVQFELEQEQLDEVLRWLA